jgi:LPS sulfotransferase NodH
MLEATKVAGVPKSYFHQPSLAAWAGYFQLATSGYDDEDQLARHVFAVAKQRGRKGGDVFGLRLQQHSFAYFQHQLRRLYPLEPNDRARIQAVFGPTAFIHLTRTDKLDQAISRVLAEQTGLWHKSADGSELERLSAPRKPVYDYNEITRQIKELTNFDEDWRRWFAAERIEPYLLTYEELSADPVNSVVRVLEWLGLDTAATKGLKVPTAKLSNAENEAWAKRFRSEQTETGIR